MAASFPASVKSFTTKVDNVNSVMAVDINGIQDEVVAIETALGAPMQGWQPAIGTWTYASASTITVPTDATTTYQKGMKLRWKQGAGYKYGTIKIVAATLITIVVNADYTVANSAITDVYYSMTERPFGFPDWFNWTPTLTKLSAYTTAVYRVSGLRVDIIFIADFKTISAGAGVVNVSLPITVVNSANQSLQINDGTNWVAAMFQIYTLQMDFYKTTAAGNWAGGETNVRLSVSCSYSW